MLNLVCQGIRHKILTCKVTECFSTIELNDQISIWFLISYRLQKISLNQKQLKVFVVYIPDYKTTAMELFTHEDKLFDVINTNHNLLPVFNRFGIRPGFKDKTVKDICIEKNINQDFFLALINTYHNPAYFPENELLSFPPELIVNYLRKTHSYYIDYFLPKIETHLNDLINGNKAGGKDLKMIVTFYEKYKKEFLLHIKDEEENVFPHVLKMLNEGKEHKDVLPAVSFEKEHSNVEEKLGDLKNLILKYLSPSYEDNDFNEFLEALFHFERDIIDHAHIEDKILVPQIEKIKQGH